MASTILVGTQWGDEGKGKVTDLISGEYDVVCRCQGGKSEAGHARAIGLGVMKDPHQAKGYLHPVDGDRPRGGRQVSLVIYKAIAAGNGGGALGIFGSRERLGHASQLLPGVAGKVFLRRRAPRAAA